MQTRKHQSRGVDGEDARHQARVKFGSAAGIAEQCRDERGMNFVDVDPTLARYDSDRLAPLYNRYSHD